jgi:hypothetical protein
MITSNTQLTTDTELSLSISPSVCLPDNLAPTAVLGTNRTSTLLRATDRQLGTDVVVKILQQPAWLADRERAVQKKRLCAAIRPFCREKHPVLAPYSSIKEHNGTVFAVRQFLDGLSLRDRVLQGGSLTLNEALCIVHPVAQAIDCLAQGGYRHGAVKSENIFIGEYGEVQLTDAGFRSAASDLDIAGVRCQTDALGAGSDISALAAMVWEAITGASVEDLLATPDAFCSRNGLTAKRVALFRRAAQRRGSFRTAESFVQALEPTAVPVLFQAVWRPAAAAGLLGALATVGGNASSEDRSGMSSSSFRKTTISVNAPAFVAPSPTRYLDALSEEDRSYLALALRRRGIAALNHPEIADVFHLTAAQSKEITRLLADQRTELERSVESKLAESESFRRGAPAGGAKVGTQSSEPYTRDAVNTRVYLILNQPQRTLWDAMERQPIGSNDPVF